MRIRAPGKRLPAYFFVARFAIGSIFLFWVLLAYVGLPRLQEVLSKVYVPDYFIGRSLTDIGVLGDPINLALDGSEADIHAAMTRAGWVRAEELTIRSSWRIVVSSVLRRPYPQAPVSSLFLFGQRQCIDGRRLRCCGTGQAERRRSGDDRGLRRCGSRRCGTGQAQRG